MADPHVCGGHRASAKVVIVRYAKGQIKAAMLMFIPVE